MFCIATIPSKQIAWRNQRTKIKNIVQLFCCILNPRRLYQLMQCPLTMTALLLRARTDVRHTARCGLMRDWKCTAQGPLLSKPLLLIQRHSVQRRQTFIITRVCEMEYVYICRMDGRGASYITRSALPRARNIRFRFMRSAKNTACLLHNKKYTLHQSEEGMYVTLIGNYLTTQYTYSQSHTEMLVSLLLPFPCS